MSTSKRNEVQPHAKALFEHRYDHCASLNAALFAWTAYLFIIASPPRSDDPGFGLLACLGLAVPTAGVLTGKRN
jgi:hypothetical protein